MLLDESAPTVVASPGYLQSAPDDPILPCPALPCLAQLDQSNVANTFAKCTRTDNGGDALSSEDHAGAERVAVRGVRLKVPSFWPLISVDYLCLLTLNMFTFCKTRLLM